MSASHARSGRRPHTLSRLTRAVLAAIGAQWCVSAAQALPQGGQVTAGEARIAQSNDRGAMNITQFSERAVIDWKTFDIGEKETVNFTQPKPDYVMMNRVNGGSVSSILGKLSADGRVFLINPNGVVFGPHSQVDVAGLVATTANISNKEFMAGRMTFVEPGKTGARIVNQGRITASNGGLVALVAPGVENEGVIQANLGKVTLASGNVFTLDLFGDQLVTLSIDDKIAEKMLDTEGRPVRALIQQSGRVQADGGDVVLLTAAAAKDIVDRVINMSGVVSARSVSERAGTIVLHGASGGEVHVGGELDVSAIRASTDEVLMAGGTIKVLGEQVTLAKGARLDASGDDGGRIFIGADHIGDERVNGATRTTIEKGARIFADGLERGDGGDARAWADDTLAFAGEIYARGGRRQGDGGYVELAAGKSLRFDGSVDVSAANGRPGKLVKIPEPLQAHDTQDDAPAPGNVDAPPAPVPGETQDGANDSGGSPPTKAEEAPRRPPTGDAAANPPPAPSEASTSIIPSTPRDNEVTRVNSTVYRTVDAVLSQPRADMIAPLDMVRIELAADLDLDEGASFVPDYRLVPRPDGLKELHLPNPFLLRLYSNMQLGGDMRMLGGMASFGGGGHAMMFSFQGGAGGGAVGSGGVGGGGVASAPGRLPQNAQSAEEALAGDVPTDGKVEFASATAEHVSSNAEGNLQVAALTDKEAVADARQARSKETASGSRNADLGKNTVALVASPCAGDGRAMNTQVDHQLSEFTPRDGDDAKAALARTAAAGTCAQGGGAARERARGNQSFVAYGLVSGGRGVAQAADLGRNSPVSGAVSDVFRVSYHVINAPRYVRGLGLSNNYFCIGPFGDNLCARAFNKIGVAAPRAAAMP